DADATTIKKAFRRLAMRWHPDRNPDPAALEHFKRLRAAHDRMLGSQDGDDSETGEADTQDESPSAARAESGFPRGADRWQDLELSLEEAFSGCEKQVPLESVVICDTCEGSGRIQLAHGRLCQCCHGTGRIRTKGGLVACDDCGGRGYSNQAPCPDCDGVGTRRPARMLLVKVPAGMFVDEELRLEGKGEQADSTEGRPGDLRLRVRLSPHPLFRLDGRDLLLERPVNAFRMLAGGKLVVPVPGGTLEVDVEAGTCESRELRIEGAGFRGRGARPAGALRIKLHPVFPAAPGPKLVALYRKLDAEIQHDIDTSLPQLAEWERTWLSAL
ncbi:MAG: molecular chaperone DnaJ, partial [Betaproteobacteria bacterium HGW-Betaproteobacteria-21]